jgi:hypothetical protein
LFYINIKIPDMSNSITITINVSDNLLEKLFKLDRENKVELIRARKDAAIDLLQTLAFTRSEQADSSLHEELLTDEECLESDEEEELCFPSENVALNVVSDSEDELESDLEPGFTIEESDLEELGDDDEDEGDEPDVEQILNLLKGLDKLDDEQQTTKSETSRRCIEKSRFNKVKRKRRGSLPIDNTQSFLKQTFGLDGKDVVEALHEIVKADDSVDPIQMLGNAFNKVCQASTTGNQRETE